MSAMTDDAGAGVPSMARQHQLVSEIGAVIRQAWTGDWTTATYRTRAVAGYQEDELQVRLVDGTQRRERPPRGLVVLAEKLRDVMYRLGAGTWWSATFAVNSSGEVSANFDYDAEPAWVDEIDRAWYAQDLNKYPRDDDAIPTWLRERLAGPAT
jgi:hypothetical protein